MTMCPEVITSINMTWQEKRQLRKDITEGFGEKFRPHKTTRRRKERSEQRTRIALLRVLNFHESMTLDEIQQAKRWCAAWGERAKEKVQ